MRSRKRIPKSVRLLVYEKCNCRCAYCGCKLEYKDMQVDHVESVYKHDYEKHHSYSKTLTDEEFNSIDNYMPACRACNFYKGTYSLETFRRNLSTMLYENLRKNFNYKLLCKYGLIKEEIKPVEFYFERMEKDESKLAEVMEKLAKFEDEEERKTTVPAQFIPIIKVDTGDVVEMVEKKVKDIVDEQLTVLGKERHGVLHKIANYLTEEYEGDDDNAPTLDITISDMREICRMHQDLSSERKLLKQGQMYGREWIPCSERLPKKPEIYGDSDGYIVQTRRVEQPFIGYWDGREWTDEEVDVVAEVIAWMPLPEPYREVR